jgi:ribosomal protein S12 methylthiotransferase
MAAAGIRELNLVAQDLTHYGIETRYQENLPKLLRELAKVDGIDWIRLHYVYPDEFSEDLLEVIATEPKIVKYLDMPIQHTNDRVLSSMARRLTKQKLFTVVEGLRARIPGIVFRTSIIVGFPGETEEEFQELCNDLNTLNLDHVGVFPFSKEEGTKAADLDQQLHPATRRRRARTLIELLQKQRLARNVQYVGTLQTVLIEGLSQESELLIAGRLPTQAQEIDGNVLINDLGELEGQPLSPGDLVEVEITEAMPLDVVGRATRLLSRSKTAGTPVQPGLKSAVAYERRPAAGYETSNSRASRLAASLKN